MDSTVECNANGVMTSLDGKVQRVSEHAGCRLQACTLLLEHSRCCLQACTLHLERACPEVAFSHALKCVAPALSGDRHTIGVAFHCGFRGYSGCLRSGREELAEWLTHNVCLDETLRCLNRAFVSSTACEWLFNRFFKPMNCCT